MLGLGLLLGGPGAPPGGAAPPAAVSASPAARQRPWVGIAMTSLASANRRADAASTLGDGAADSSPVSPDAQQAAVLSSASSAACRSGGPADRRCPCRGARERAVSPREAGDPGAVDVLTCRLTVTCAAGSGSASRWRRRYRSWCRGTAGRSASSASVNRIPSRPRPAWISGRRTTAERSASGVTARKTFPPVDGIPRPADVAEALQPVDERGGTR